MPFLPKEEGPLGTAPAELYNVSKVRRYGFRSQLHERARLTHAPRSGIRTGLGHLGYLCGRVSTKNQVGSWLRNLGWG